ncbi:hypothetical protein SAMN04487830_12241 [Pseudobutyrivibrio sp. OR37]|uniref:hypothetical protein n=1 Tax=Pseudobutyrivibrio sp. OR37 TaxID=1798186 RepID=UPI0008E39B66|nr:hypothetical protein [Pseudobutyrivibrio sp. OR37]SFI10050.1 hypothetical protein SAMN04487830_12241 [Pseudobutyrivibrio sp. OR37]
MSDTYGLEIKINSINVDTKFKLVDSNKSGIVVDDTEEIEGVSPALSKFIEEYNQLIKTLYSYRTLIGTYNNMGLGDLGNVKKAVDKLQETDVNLGTSMKLI